MRGLVATENVNPDIYISNLPKDTKSLALIVEDPDVPGGVFDHWIMWNIPVNDRILENSSPGIEGLNSERTLNYIGPCPPRYCGKLLKSSAKTDNKAG